MFKKFHKLNLFLQIFGHLDDMRLKRKKIVLTC